MTNFDTMSTVSAPTSVYRDPVLQISREQLVREPRSKRAVDVIAAMSGLLLSAPAWVAISLAIKLDDGGPIFFHHERMGKDGRLFHAIKFRTMVPAPAGTRIPPRGHPDESLITRVGRILRPTALDELPQLLNILRGNMSLVGPRALSPIELDWSGEPVDLSSVPGFRERHRVRPGLTGPAQVRAPRDISYRHKFRYDVFYVRHRSLLYDLKLIFHSLMISLGGRWPHIGAKKR
jgi:lipopolysaccharide/colanic/teichoic acid biosynthesis glycosyltransferase